MSKCPVYEELESEVLLVLEQLVDLTTKQLDAFQAANQPLFMRLDRQLENTVGRKERTIGALRQHVRDHKCFTR